MTHVASGVENGNTVHLVERPADAPGKRNAIMIMATPGTASSRCILQDILRIVSRRSMRIILHLIVNFFGCRARVVRWAPGQRSAAVRSQQGEHLWGCMSLAACTGLNNRSKSTSLGAMTAYLPCLQPSSMCRLSCSVATICYCGHQQSQHPLLCYHSRPIIPLSQYYCVLMLICC